MSDSTLSFASSSSFRNSLMVRNLQPYNVQGAYTPPSGDLNYEVSPLQDSSVIDSPDNLIGTNQLANGLYSLNEYGPEGGYNGKYTVPGQPLPVDSNQGPYNPNNEDFQTIDLVNEFFIDAAYIQNKYGPEGGFNDLVIVTDVQLSEQYFQAYNEPFVNSLYKPYQILISQNPNGTDGTLSQDTFLAKIAATSLKSAFEERIAYEISYSNSQGPSVPLGFGNINTLNSPFSNLFTNFNNQPLTNKDWKITSPEDTQANSQQFTDRIQENYYPSSPIPGDYFESISPIQAPAAETALENINNVTGNLGPVLNLLRNPSELFISNTGKGQQSTLFNSLDYNTYRPSYNRGDVSSNLVNAVANFLDNDPQITGKYYVGSSFSEPSLIVSPPNQVAVNSFGKQQNTIVYGPSELGILYEGNEDRLNFGLKGKSITDGGGIMGEFIWTSPKYQPNAGFKVSKGGDPTKIDEEFNSISSEFNQNRSADFDLKSGSILDDTQRIIDAADKVTGKARLKHVGNAINQISKVFNDGYKEITKGSKVIAYYDSVTEDQTIGIEGNEVGREYCRIFQKDTPYYTYKDLQKSDGITTSGRKFHNSVLDNTFNLNIAPLRGNDSTNIRDGKVKKYMFSLENLAWRTSDKPGFTIQDLPSCERGPNGGRIMWFPPYDLSFSEDSKAQWNPTKFLGRPEPIYTYQNSTRSGNISWRIIVDNPSALNTIIEKQLSSKSDDEVNSIIDSFFAGCVKYDLYDLAAKFNQIPISELFTYQEILNNPNATSEEINQVISDISGEKTQNNEGGDNGNQSTNNDAKDNVNIDSYETETREQNFGIYFRNSRPNGVCGQEEVDDSYTTYYLDYSEKFETYRTSSKGTTNNGNTWTVDDHKNFINNEVKDSLETLNKVLNEIANQLIKGFEVTFNFNAITSAAGSSSCDGEYNNQLARRRYSSVRNYILNKPITENTTFKTYEDNNQLKLVKPEKVGFDTKVTVNGKEIDCSKTGNEVFTVPATACRSVQLKSFSVKEIKLEEEEEEIIEDNEELETIVITPKKIVKRPDVIQKLKNNISKKILRNLFSECDYFEVIKETDPMIYQSLKDKIKYFDPAFHSITPEGLNSRLTFLNQCMRPGQTIPVIGNDNQLKYNDALNTSFGTPPVLVLRIGDFYHTKIIPNSLGISYDPLLYDLNPEGIGVQPMVAKITLGFDFIGGQGLANPIKQLQNALSFNYYGNTEIYDERSITTEDTSERDKELIKLLVSNNGPAITTKEIQNNQPQKGLTPIGEVITSNFNIETSVESGELNYYKHMVELQENSKNYFNTIVNQSKSITEVTNWGISQLVFNERNYSQGSLSEFNVPQTDMKIYGKSNNVAKSFKNLIEDCIKDVNDSTNPIIKPINLPETPNNVLRSLKQNIKKNLISNEIELNLLVQQQINAIVGAQEILNYTLRKTDVICNNLDGVKIKTGDIKVYNLTGNTETITYFRQQIYTISLYNDFNTFLVNLKDNNIIGEQFYNKKTNTYTFSVAGKKVTTAPDQRYYLGMCNILLNENNFNTFVNSLINDSSIKGTKYESIIKKSCDEFRNNCINDHNLELKTFDNFENNVQYKRFKDFNILFLAPESAPSTDLINIDYFKDKNIGYTTENTTNSNKNIVKNLYNNKNLNQNKKTFNGKVTFN